MSKLQGQTSGLTVRGVSDSVALGREKLPARGPVNRQTGGLPNDSTCIVANKEKGPPRGGPCDSEL